MLHAAPKGEVAGAMALAPEEDRLLRAAFGRYMMAAHSRPLALPPGLGAPVFLGHGSLAAASICPITPFVRRPECTLWSRRSANCAAPCPKCVSLKAHTCPKTCLGQDHPGFRAD